MILGEVAAQQDVCGQIGGVGAQLRVVHAAGNEGSGGNEGVSAGVVGDAGLVEDFRNGALTGHDGVVGGGEHGLNPAHQSVGGGEDFVGRVAGLFNVCDALAVQVRLCLGNGGYGVGFAVGVKQAHGLNVGLGSQHHVQNEGGVQGVRGAGDVGQAGEAGGLGIGDGGVDHGDARVFRGGGHGGGGQGGDGKNGVNLIGNHLGGDLVQHGGVVLTVVILVVYGNALFGSHFVQLGFHGQPDFIQGGVVQLLDDGHVEDLTGFGFGGGGFGRNGFRSGRSGSGGRSGGRGGTAGGKQRSGQNQAGSDSKELLHNNNSFLFKNIGWWVNKGARFTIVCPDAS